jgi:hypothetical protein
MQMTIDIQKLKALAGAAIAEADNFSAYASGEDVRSRQEFRSATSPPAVLELISEIERITGENQRLRAGVESDLAEIDRIQGVYDAHFRKTRSYRMQRDQAKDQSDQLKAENEALRQQLAVPSEVLADAEALRVENERLRSQVDRLLDHCPDGECLTCGEIICPHGGTMHFHHDGCPSCAQYEEDAIHD